MNRIINQQNLTIYYIVKFSLQKIGTPNAAGFRPVNFSTVGEYTGSTSINVPIYQIQIGQINIPIELNYSSTGIKVDF